MAGKLSLYIAVTLSLIFTGCAASKTMEKPAVEAADTNKAEAATAASEVKDPKAEAKKISTLGLAAMMHGNWEKAEGYFLEALKLDPDNYNAHMYLARVYENKGQKPEALEHYKAGVKLKPDNPNPYYGMMGVYLDMGNAEDAIFTANDAIKNGISEDKLAGNLGWAYYVNGDLGKAEKYFKKDKEQKKADSTPRNNLGLVYFSQGRYEDALASFNEASELNEKSVVLPYFQALTYNRLGREEEVLKALEEGINRTPDLESRAPALNKKFFFNTDPGDLSAAFKKLKEKKN
jgi:Flp pilus assembly protein TadD